MSQGRERLDHLFEVGLILLGIYSAAEFGYFMVLGPATAFPYYLKVFTLPFLGLILLWMLKDIFNDYLILNFILTDFCWGLWNYTLFYFLLAIYGYNLLGIALCFSLSLIIFLSIFYAYYRDSVNAQDKKFEKYYRNVVWLTVRWFVYISAYLFIIIILIPQNAF